MDTGLVVVVPPRHQARETLLTKALAGTDIRVVVDRRQGERRRAHEPSPIQRRQGDRRGTARVVAYVYACPVMLTEAPRFTSPAAEVPGVGVSSLSDLESTTARN